MFQPRPHTGAAPWRCAHTAWALAMAVSLAVPLAAHAAQALRVVRDPVTGEMRSPTAAEAAAFDKADAQLRASLGKTPPKKPIEIYYPDGTVETKLDEDTMMYSVVRANEDGSLVMDCLPAKEARAFVKAPKKSAAVKNPTKAAHVHQ